MSLALGINLQQPGSAQDAGTAPPPPQPPKKEPEPEPEPVVERTPEEQKAYDQKQLALAHKAKGNAAYKKRDFDAALKHYDDAIAADPGDVTYRNNKCAVHFEKKDYDAVLSEGREAIKVGREHRADYELVHKIYVRMGKARMKQGDLEGALEEFNNAQVEHRDKATERLVKNLEMDIKKKKREAYIDPAKALEEKEKGNVKFREGKFSESVPFYEEAMKRDPKNPAYPNNLAAALTKLGNFAAAKQACEKALELDEKYVKAIAKKGDLEMLMKEYHKAIETYKKGLTIEPANAACKQGLQRVQTAIYNEGGDKGRAEQAMKDPEIQAILQDPMVRQVIQDLSGGNGAAGQQAMNDPVMRGKIEKLIASGVLQTK
jgi:stress-induced-phosphoprotein 1